MLSLLQKRKRNYRWDLLKFSTKFNYRHKTFLAISIDLWPYWPLNSVKLSWSSKVLKSLTSYWKSKDCLCSNIHVSQRYGGIIVVPLEFIKFEQNQNHMTTRNLSELTNFLFFEQETLQSILPLIYYVLSAVEYPYKSLTKKNWAEHRISHGDRHTHKNLRGSTVHTHSEILLSPFLFNSCRRRRTAATLCCRVKVKTMYVLCNMYVCMYAWAVCVAAAKRWVKMTNFSVKTPRWIVAIFPTWHSCSFIFIFELFFSLSGRSHNFWPALVTTNYRQTSRLGAKLKFLPSRLRQV